MFSMAAFVNLSLKVVIHTFIFYFLDWILGSADLIGGATNDWVNGAIQSPIFECPNQYKE
jgi:hypothetical protein